MAAMASGLASELTLDILDVLGPDVSYVRLAGRNEHRSYLTGIELGTAVAVAVLIGFLKGVVEGVGETLGKPLGRRLGERLAVLLQLEDEATRLRQDSLDELRAEVRRLQAQLDELLDAYRADRPLGALTEAERAAVLASATTQVAAQLERSGFPPPRAAQQAARLAGLVDARLEA